MIGGKHTYDPRSKKKMVLHKYSTGSMACALFSWMQYLGSVMYGKSLVHKATE